MRFPAALIVLLHGAAALADPSPPPARGGDALFEHMEASPAVVIATVEERSALDSRSFLAVVRVESQLANAAGPAAKPAKRVQIAWEELARQRPPRFTEGDRLVLALAPLGSASIWKARIPDPDARAQTFAVADAGRAFVRSPKIGSTDTLEHFLALPPDARNEATGVLYLSRLSALAQLDLARAALVRLGQVPGLDSALSAEARSQLIAALARGDSNSEFETRLLDLLARQGLDSMRAPLLAEIARYETAPPVLYHALGAVDGAVPREHAERLLEDSNPEYRLAAAQSLGGEHAGSQLRRLARQDPDARVRQAALRRLLALEGADALGSALDALRDPAPPVRGVAALALGELGEPALAGLRSTAYGNDPQAALASVVALERMGETEILAELAASHPDLAIRSAADIALGREIGHRH